MKPHLFSYNDVYRIVRVVEPSRDWKTVDTGWVFLTILAAEKDLLTSLRLKNIKLFDEQGGVEFLLKQITWLASALAGAPMGFVASLLARFVELLGLSVPPPPPQAPPVEPVDKD